MFTGIIQSIGNLHKKTTISPTLQRWEILSDMDTSDVKIGDSIAVDGVCLTVTNIGHGILSFDLGKETLDVTALGYYPLDKKLHLEKAMRLSDRLGGHLVQGHVDCVENVVDVQKEGECTVIHIAIPDDKIKYCIKKGSVTLNGVSLTINWITSSGFDVCLIPHTLDQTNLGALKKNDPVNIEVDLIAKYVERMTNAFQK